MSQGEWKGTDEEILHDAERRYAGLRQPESQGVLGGVPLATGICPAVYTYAGPPIPCLLEAGHRTDSPHENEGHDCRWFDQQEEEA